MMTATVVVRLALFALAFFPVPNLGTSEQRSFTTAGEGRYNFPAVPPGEYRLEVELEGFRRFTQEPLGVRVQQFVNADARLEVGQSKETIVVEGRAAILDTSTSSVGLVVENEQIVDLPVNGRNTLSFVALTPGVRTQGGFGENPATVNFQTWGNFSVNGGMANSKAHVVLDERSR